MSNVAVCGLPAFVNCCARGSSRISASSPIWRRLYWISCACSGAMPEFDDQSTALPPRRLPSASFFACFVVFAVIRSG